MNGKEYGNNDDREDAQSAVKFVPFCFGTAPSQRQHPVELVSPDLRIVARHGQIEELVNQGVLNKGQGNALTVKLDQALKQWTSGKPKQAINAMNAFINQVNSLYTEGVLPQEVAEGLVKDAEIIIAAIEAKG